MIRSPDHAGLPLVFRPFCGFEVQTFRAFY
jgi:hypothetical protein